MNLEKFNRFAPLVLRTGIAVVLLWFAFSQLKNPASWTRMVPDYALFLGIDKITLIYINGVLEIVLAVLLLLGLFTRVAAGLTTLHLLHITTIVGYGATGARDFALTVAALSAFLAGTDEFCLDRILWHN